MRSTGKVYMHAVENRKKKEERPAPTEAMIAQRERFRAITKMVAQMRSNPIGKLKNKSQKQLWKIAAEAYDAASK